MREYRAKYRAVFSFPSHRLTGLSHVPKNRFDNAGPVYQALPDFLAQIKYQDVTDNANTVHQVGHNTSLPAFLWLMEQPRLAAYFNQYMFHRRQDQSICWDVYPVEKELAGNSDSDLVVLVDVGGNVGHQCAEFKKHFPTIQGKLVLQDVQSPISMALSTPGVENQVYDMFTPQPVRGMPLIYLTDVPPVRVAALPISYSAQILHKHIQTLTLLRTIQAPNTTICAPYCTTGPTPNVARSSVESPRPWGPNLSF